MLFKLYGTVNLLDMPEGFGVRMCPMLLFHRGLASFAISVGRTATPSGTVQLLSHQAEVFQNAYSILYIYNSLRGLFQRSLHAYYVYFVAEKGELG